MHQINTDVGRSISQSIIDRLLASSVGELIDRRDNAPGQVCRPCFDVAMLVIMKNWTPWLGEEALRSIKAAVSQNMTILPILVDDASFPLRQRWPKELASVCDWQAVRYLRSTECCDKIANDLTSLHTRLLETVADELDVRSISIRSMLIPSVQWITGQWLLIVQGIAALICVSFALGLLYYIIYSFAIVVLPDYTTPLLSWDALADVGRNTRLFCTRLPEQSFFTWSIMRPSVIYPGYFSLSCTFVIILASSIKLIQVCVRFLASR